MRDLYHAWVRDDSLDAPALARVLSYALSCSDVLLLTSVLRHPSCSPLHSRLLMRAGADLVRFWVVSAHATPDLLLEWAHVVDLDVVASLLSGDLNLGTEASVLWDRAASRPDLRLRLAERTLVPDPAWAPFLASLEMGSDRRAGLVERFSPAAPAAAWTLALPDPAVLFGLYVRLPSLERSPERTRTVWALLLDLYQDGWPDALSDPAADCLYRVARQQRRADLPFQELFDFAWRVRDDLYPRAARMAQKAVDALDAVPSAADLLASMASGELPHLAVKGANMEPGRLSSELWVAVATHPHLRPAQGVELLRRCSKEEAGTVLASRDTVWLVAALARAAQRDGAARPVLDPLLSRLSPAEQEAALAPLLGAPEGALRLVSLGLLSSSLVARLPLSTVSSEPRLGAVAMRAASERFGSSEACWEVFDALAGVPSVSWGDHLDAVCELARR